MGNYILKEEYEKIDLKISQHKDNLTTWMTVTEKNSFQLTRVDLLQLAKALIWTH